MGEEGTKPGPWSGSPIENSMLNLFLNIFFSKRPRILQNHHGNTSPVIIPQCRGWAAGGSYEVSTDGLILSASLLAQMAVVLTTHTHFSNVPTHDSRDALFGGAAESST